MRCKPGDLAVTVALSHQRSATALRNTGRIVEVVRFVGWFEFGCGTIKHSVWVCKNMAGPIVDGLGRSWVSELHIDDANLRPIRDNPGNEKWFKAAPLSTPSQPRQTAPHTNTTRAPAEV